MGKTIFIGEKSINILKENLNELVVDKNSDFTNPNEFWFILYRGDLLFFTYESRGLLDAFFERHENELKKWADKYDNSKDLYSQFEFNNFIVRFGASVPHLITGRISNSDVYINANEEYDILNSNELYQLVKEYPKYTFYLDRKKIDTNATLNNKGKGKPKFWYHGTTIGNALEILKGGLRPTPSNTIYKIKHDKTVFLTSSFETARWYANNKTKHSYGMQINQPCVIKIDANHIDNDKIVYDYDVYNAHVVNKNDSIYNDSNLLYPNETNTIQKETDPKKYLKVGYRGIIMPSAILSVYEVDYTREEEYSVEDFVKKYTQESVNEAKPEVDEYEIGQESDNPPIGGNYCHVNENASFDTSEIGGVNYSWDFDEDEYQEWLADMEYENNQETLMEYITDNVEFELEYLDNQTYHAFNREYVDYNTLEEMFGSKMQNEILKTCMNNSEGSFDVDELFSENDVDINNQESINNIAMKLLRHGDYFKGCRGFILTNGIVVYTEMEHNEICRIPNVNDKLDFVRMGNIRILPQSIDIGARPTNEQREVLMQVINSYSDEELYLDIFEGKGSIGAKYVHPNWRFVMGEIDRYYNEGIKPQGNVQYEEKNKTILVSENQLKSIKENLDFEVNSSEIDLSSFKKKTSLAPNIWDENDILDSRIRLKLLDIADDFWNFVNLTWVKPKGIILTGSICNFNWSTYSDIDLHLIVDFNEIDEKTEFVKEYLDAKKNEWNNEHEDLKIFGYQVELYTQNIDEMPQSGGIYDLEQNKWIKKPSPNDIKAIALDKYPIKDKAAKIMTIIDDMYDTLSSTNDNHEIEEIGKDAKYLWKKIKSMRKQSLEKHGENGIGNICYKYMRRSGYLDKLWKLRTLCYDKTNSINESVDEMQAWHGTDAVFDKFDLAFLSKGEGSQEYGKGIYVTSSKSTGEHYIEIIRGTRMNTKGKEYMRKKHDAYDDEKTVAQEDFQDFLDNYDSIYDNLPGYLYKVDIPDDNGNNYFDYVASMSPQEARNVFINYCKEGLIRNNKYSDERFNRVVKKVNSDTKWDNVKNGRDFHIALYDEGIDLSKVVASMGYIGTKVPIGYLHGMKYGRGKNKMNYVIFDPQNIKIISRKDILANKTTRFNESKEVIKEYLEKDNNLPLYKYFKWAKEASSCDKAEDLAYNCAYYIGKYIETTSDTNPIFEELLDENGKFDYEDDSKIEGFLKILKENNLCDDFIENMEYIVEYIELPSWCTMDFNRIVKNEWCIHFGSDSYSISREGFTGGTPDIDRLAYTNDGQQKHMAGYDFAFLIDDRNVDYNEYGNEAVIFRTSGVEIYHYGDNQHQVIFWGPNVKSFIPISQDNGDWVVYGHKGQVLFRGENPSDVASWATYNLPQYRKQIMTGKNGYIPKQTVYDEHGYRKRVPYPLYRNESINNSLPLINENIDIFKLAKEHFGTTYDIRECGYILPSGEMLDFSGRHEITRPSDATHLNGRRAIDHRCIYEIGWNINKDTKLFDITMEDFIRQGAVRISPSNSWSTINLYVKPTKEQIDVISRLVRFSHGNVTVEIGDGNESLSYAEYDEAKPSRVIGEILRYFDEGVNLMGNVSESRTLLKNKTIREYITYLKNSFVNEEFNADGSSNGNPYAKRWKAERQALKDFICNYGVLMQSKEDNKEGRVYKCFWDKTLSNLIGYNYCLAVQYDEVNLKPKSTIYVRACDRFTRNIRRNLQYDTRGKDNQTGTLDDVRM